MPDAKAPSVVLAPPWGSTAFTFGGSSANGGEETKSTWVPADGKSSGFAANPSVTVKLTPSVESSPRIGLGTAGFVK
ncbi:hypothetical protein SAMN05421837_11823 [Amycolatopsis pretoriensis]|uniref:Uncharacterized protein n=1 Tax=Amycolatopsis pretoriensis TaxID=218821 RepID=A0A1H5RI88_9PSEU|nr:hypothetical protein SAMN05421837_11823 [Amycolatopsis pretoriensis]